MDISRKDFLKASVGATGLVLLNPQVQTFDKDIQTTEGKAMLIDITKCISCWWCYAACKSHNKLTETLKPDPEEPPPLSAEVWTTLKPVKIDSEWHSRKHACNHCTNAACVEVCPTGALSYNLMGFVQYEKEKCSGCGYCAEFCPFGVPQLHGNQLTGISIMDKCTFCIDRVSNGEQPACAAACTTGAITFGNRSDLVKEGREKVAALHQTNVRSVFYGDKELGGLHVMYVLDDSPEVYGLPTDPKIPDPILARDIFKWLGIGAVAAVIAGFGLNYLIAREVKKTNELPREKNLEPQDEGRDT